MFDMFDMCCMFGDYARRNVANYKNDVMEIDTSLVINRTKPYETAIKHRAFNDGNWIVLGHSGTKEEAMKDHDNWVELLSGDTMRQLVDVDSVKVYDRRDIHEKA